MIQESPVEHVFELFVQLINLPHSTVPPDSAVFIALVLGVCTWPFNFFLEGKFDMSDWSFAFPLDALAAASIIVYSYTRYDTMQVGCEASTKQRLSSTSLTG